jgi:hypothetical protein
MSLILQSSGGGQITIQEPATASNFTQNLPAVSGNIVTTGDSGTITQGMLATAASSVGVGQTWQAPSRAIGTTYTNSTGKPIVVTITASCTQGFTVQGLLINGATVYAGSVNVANAAFGFSLIVPNGATYVTTTNAGTLSLVSWAELR